MNFWGEFGTRLNGLQFGTFETTTAGARSTIHPTLTTRMGISTYPIASMTGIFTYIYHKHQLNVGKYTSPMDPMGIGLLLVNCLHHTTPGDPEHIRLEVLHCASNHPKWQPPWREDRVGKGKAVGFCWVKTK